ncbi:MAG: hypothetical protein J5449_01705 [Oscillospiraceae bacterium]|nr:hypothetical protein [Oscillospiraceae bacterium]
MYRHKSKSRPVSEEPRALDRRIRAGLANAAGGRLYGNDPVSSVSDMFQRSFDALGRENSARFESRGYGEPAEVPDKPGTGENTAERDSGRRPLPGSKSEGMYLRGFPAGPVPLRRFSDVAFRHGNLAGSILQGTGKMMLVSCLRRTINPRRPEKHDFFQDNVNQIRLTGHDPDSMVFTRDLVRGAVSIVVDTLHESRRTVEMLSETVERGEKGSKQLFAAYPFLDDSRERELLEQYRAELSESPEVNRRALLQSAVVHTEAMIEKKAETRLRFVTALRSVAEHARAAIEEFEDPGFIGAVEAELTEGEPEDVPPPDDPNKNRRPGGAPPEEGRNADVGAAQRDVEQEQPDEDAGSEGKPEGKCPRRRG